CSVFALQNLLDLGSATLFRARSGRQHRQIRAFFVVNFPRNPALAISGLCAFLSEVVVVYANHGSR
ncbi:MAG: hypothetical protein AAFY19_08775, partial [Pseudomonadota bacterium]